MSTIVSGFSKLTKEEKINWIIEHCLNNDPNAKTVINQYWNEDKKLQKLHDEFSENTISNFYLPFGLAPNFKINDQLLTIPMVVEESSVVAAASKAAKFWLNRGGFKTTILGSTKLGHVHFNFEGSINKLRSFFDTILRHLELFLNNKHRCSFRGRKIDMEIE